MGASKSSPREKRDNNFTGFGLGSPTVGNGLPMNSSSASRNGSFRRVTYDSSSPPSWIALSPSTEPERIVPNAERPSYSTSAYPSTSTRPTTSTTTATATTTPSWSNNPRPLTYDNLFESWAQPTAPTASTASIAPTAPPRRQLPTFFDSDDDDYRTAVRQSMVENYARPSQTAQRVSLSTPLVRQNPPVIRSVSTATAAVVGRPAVVRPAVVIPAVARPAVARPAVARPAPISNVQQRLPIFSMATQNQTKPLITQAEPTTNAPATKGEMTFDCSICMEFNENYMIVATECGHIFHKECVSPWIQQAGTCPTCRLRATTASLRKLFVSMTKKVDDTSSSNDTKNVRTSTNANKRRANNNATSQNRSNRTNSNRPVVPAIAPLTTFNRSIWLSSTDKTINNQTLATAICERFNLSPEKVTIKSLRKQNSPQCPYVSFKINVDSQYTFNTLLNITAWPRTIRIREFIEH